MPKNKNNDKIYYIEMPQRVLLVLNAALLQRSMKGYAKTATAFQNGISLNSNAKHHSFAKKFFYERMIVCNLNDW